MTRPRLPVINPAVAALVILVPPKIAVIASAAKQ
jgi:hypothetical protein